MSHFILTSFQAAISETSLHNKWLNAVVLHEYIHQWYCSNGLQFTLVAMMRCINKAYQNSSYNANYVETSNGTKLDMYIQHQRQQGETKKSYYFYITKTGAAAPALPTAGSNTSAWEAVIAVNWLLPPPATRLRPELVDVELVSNPHQSDSRKRRVPSLCHSSSPITAINSIAPAKRTRRRCNQHGRLLNGGSSMAPSSSDDATSSPDDAILASSEEGEASECMTN